MCFVRWLTRIASQMLIIGSALSLLVGCSDDDTDTGQYSDTDTDTDSDSDTDTGTGFTDDFFAINASISSNIGSVAIVEWSTTFNPIENAHIEYGRTTDYGMTAPVDLEKPDFRTLLLGMKPSTDYHFRIVVTDGDSAIESLDCPITTGPVMNGLPTYEVTTLDEKALDGGYTVGVIYTTCQIFVLDGDGDYVWWYNPGLLQCGRARMSYDGKYMLLKDLNLEGGVGRIVRITLDGLEKEIISIPSGHHDITVLPDGSVGFIGYDGEDCDNIMEFDTDGSVTEIYHLADAIDPPPNPPDSMGGCHSNAINYWEDDDSYTISILNKNQIVKVSRSGKLVWIFGGDENTFAGDDLVWEKQHGHHLYDGNILFFSNGPDGEDSHAFIYAIDETKLTADRIWDYSSGYSSYSFGESQRLPNGNILVTYSNDGVIHEVSPDGSLLQEISWGPGGALGYTMRRDSLYGPPPK